MKLKSKIFATIALSGFAIVGIVLSTRGIHNSFLTNRVQADDAYKTTLNVSNRITSNIATTTTITQRSALNSEVKFDYTNCDADSSYHAVIKTNGSIVNKSAISAISNITPTFTTNGGELKLRASYDASSWGEYTVLRSGVKFEFGDLYKPNFIELSASGASVSLTSVEYSYECHEYAYQAYEKVTSALDDYSGKYIIVDETASVALKVDNSSANAFPVTISNGKIVRTSTTDANNLIVAKDGSNYTLKSKNNEYLDYYTSQSGSQLFWSSKYTSSITFNSGLFEIKSGSHYLLFESTKFTYYESSVTSGSRLVSLYKANFDENTTIPTYESGISYTDTKANKYKIGQIFDDYVDGTGLKVSVVKSDGTTSILQKTHYSYEIKDGNDVISSSNAFITAGTYQVNILYKNYFALSYSITVNDASVISDQYELVSDAADLELNQKIIIVAEANSKVYAMSTEQRTNNRGATEITLTDNVANINSSTCEFELREGTTNSTYGLFDSTNNGYIYTSSDSSNTLKTESSISDNSSFEINVQNDIASIIAVESANRNVLQFNSSNNPVVFACYESAKMTDVKIYAKGVAPKVLVTSVSLNQSEISIDEGANYTLIPTVLPENATNKEVNWVSSDTSIATVDSNGKVVGVAPGTATITAIAKDGSGYNATCSVTVNAVPVTGVSLDKSSLTLYVGDQSALVATISPSNASNKSVTWTSSDTSVATVSNGTVSAIKQGTTTITVTTADGSYTSSCTVTVSNVLVSGFSINEETLEIYVGDEDTLLTTTITPNNATDKTIVWSSSDLSIATVSNGAVHPVAAGTATITGTCGEYSDTCEVTVKPADEKPVIQTVDGIFGTGSNTYTCTVNSHDGVKVGTSKQGGAFKVIVPAKTTKLSLYAGAWNGVSGLSLNITGASVNPSTIDLTADSGIANNSPFTLNGNEDNYKFDIALSNITEETALTFTTNIAKRAVAWRSTCEVVTSSSSTPVNVTSVTVSPSTKTVSIGDTAQLTTTVLPADATDKTVTWSSSDNSVATVSANGLVTALAVGTATITATSNDDNTIKGTCVVTVNNPTVSVTSVELSLSEKTLTVGENFTLTATVKPTNATNKAVTWQTSNANVATVSNGTVTAVAAGSAVITVKTTDGNKTATCNVTVQSSGGQQTSGTDYAVTFKQNSNDSGTQLSSDTNFKSEVTAGSSYVTYNSSSYAYPGKNGIKLGNSSNAGNITMNTSNAISSENAISVTYTVVQYSSESPSVDLYLNGTSVKSTSEAGTFTYSVSGTVQISSIKFASTKRVYISGFTIRTVPATPTNPTSVSIASNATLGLGKTTTLDVEYSAGANQNKEVNWYSSSPSVASVNKTSGLITAVAVGTTTITAKLRIDETITSSCTLEVVEQAGDKWTIMIYMCGADLESDSGQASGDIKEILNVSNQPDDVNIIIETGGASSWKLGSSYIGGSDSSIPSNKLTRWHVEGKKLYKDAEVSNASMGKSATYQSFLEWGISKYPADKMGVVLWNHGGGLDGVCFDENYSDDALTNSEMKTAHQNAIGTSNKLEFIGFDACLMQAMEIAEFNSSYYNYQVASQESENGSGWYYTGWIDDVYKNNATTVILQEIVDTFITTQGTTSDQTLSYLNLAYASTFKSAWENYASALKSQFSSKSVSGSTFASWAKSNIKNYSEAGYCGYGQFDVKNFVTKCQSNNTYKVDASYATAVTNALSNFVAYNRVGSKAGASNGVCCTYRCASQVSYNSSETNFTNWKSFNDSYHS